MLLRRWHVDGTSSSLASQLQLRTDSNQLFCGRSTGRERAALCQVRARTGHHKGLAHLTGEALSKGPIFSIKEVALMVNGAGTKDLVRPLFTIGVFQTPCHF